jgi:hypothetical protein
MFFFLGGVGGTPKIYGPVKHQVCFACRQESTFLLMRVRTCVNAFFIPLLPLGARYYLLCPGCGTRFEISEEEFKKYRDLIRRSGGMGRAV